jgi:hypothetical protein
MAQPCQNRCRQIQATKTASIGLAYDFLRFLRLPPNQTSANSSLKTKLNRQLQQSSRSQQVQPQTRQTSHPTPEKRL